MPKIHFVNLPRPLWEHILERVAERAITLDDLQQLRSWVVAEPWAPDGDWYKDFGSFISLRAGRVPKDGPEEGYEAVRNGAVKDLRRRHDCTPSGSGPKTIHNGPTLELLELVPEQRRG